MEEMIFFFFNMKKERDERVHTIIHASRWKINNFIRNMKKGSRCDVSYTKCTLLNFLFPPVCVLVCVLLS